MKKDRVLMISLISAILFSAFFIIMLICYSDIIIIPNTFFKSITKEYWFWYLDDRLPIPNESFIMGITEILKQLFSAIFLLEFIYIISDKKYINEIEKKNVVISLIIGFVIYSFSFLFIKYKAEHYRLFMTLISTEILSIILLNLILKIKKQTS
ncbi:hypothetical protein [Clostridium lundense]|uniref:hypothetical protein n=1 Tax=Clostridium lundense TaxID=319475 RepID=UPI000487EA5E|nr:hypothetical protein [Clostridium lundense]